MLNLMRRGSAILGTIPLRHQPLRNASQKEVKVAVNGAVRIFYRLVCLDKSVTDSYVGMTANVQRAINRHKRKSIIKYSYNRKIYETIRNNGNWNNWRVEILEVKIFKTIVDAYIRKQYWVTELKPIMNSMNVPYKGRKFISSPFYESSKSSFTFKHSGVVVYQLKCKDESVKDTFIGATTNLSNVLRSHRGKYESKTYNDRRLYQIIRDTGGWAKWEVCILEDSNFDSAHQINDMKAFWCDKLKPTLNGRYRAAFVELNPFKPTVSVETTTAYSSNSNSIALGVNSEPNCSEDVVPKPRNFADTDVYIIVCKDPAVRDVYVGYSTALHSAISRHRRLSALESKGDKPLYSTLRKHGGWDNWRIEALERCRCETRKDAHIRKEHWVKVLVSQGAVVIG